MSHHRRDIALLFATRIVRLFCYGFLSVSLAVYLKEIGLAGTTIGLLFTLTPFGDASITLFLTTSADRLGRNRTLIMGALLMAAAGTVFLLTRDLRLLIAAAIIGVISPSGNEIGPFLSLEQAGLSQLLPDSRRTSAFAWYNLVGSFATALGYAARWPHVAGAVPVRHAGHRGEKGHDRCGGQANAASAPHAPPLRRRTRERHASSAGPPTRAPDAWRPICPQSVKPATTQPLRPN